MVYSHALCRPNPPENCDYDDGGEVEWEEQEEYSDEEERPSKKPKATKKGALFAQPKAKAKKKQAEEPTDSHTMTSLLLGISSSFEITIDLGASSN